MSQQENSSNSQWQRFLYMVLFGIILYIAGSMVFVLVLVQFVFSLASSEENLELKRLGNSMAKYFHSVIRFLTYNSEDKPFPFAAWPQPEDDEVEVKAEATETVAPEQAKTTVTENVEDAEDAVIVLENDADTGTNNSSNSSSNNK